MRRSLLPASLTALLVALGAAALSPLALPPQPALAGPAQPDANAEASAIAESQAKLAWRLIEAETAPDRIVSPGSLASAFSVLSLGADAEMKAAMLKALLVSGDAAKGTALLAAAREALGKADPAIFTSADRLVFPPSEPPNALALAGLKALGVEASVLDLTKPEAVKQVDDWVKEKTNGVIPEILGKPLEHAAFVTLNALHFKAKWAEPFDPKATVDAPFRATDGKSDTIRLMKLGQAQRAFRQENGFVGVDLPFSGDRFSLVVVTSADKPKTLKEFSPAQAWLSGAGFAPMKGDLALPRFSLEGEADLLPPLKAELAPGLASKTALAGFVARAKIDGILQRAKIEVNEEGAEAAAVTAVIVSRALQVDDAIHMVVDKPFLFALRDRTSGLILAAGYVSKAPKEKA